MNILNALTPGDAPSAVDRAVDAWKRINDKPASVVFKRNGANLSAQTVRVELDNGGSRGQNTGVRVQGAVVYGVKDHPTVADTDMQVGDRFRWAGKQYEIGVVVLTFGEVQGQATIATT